MVHPALFLFNFWLKYVKRTKIVIIVHMLWWKAAQSRWKARYARFVEKILLKRGDLIIANSNHSKKEMVVMEIPSEAIKVVYPGFDLPPRDEMGRSPVRAHEGLKLLSIANLSPNKGLDTLVEALHRLNNPKITLDVVGDDLCDRTYSRRLKARVSRWRLENQVRFHGVQEPEILSRFYAAADIFVLPSRYESFGIVVAEAMGFGVPIIATRVGGLPELVEDGENGVLVPPKDVDSLAAAIHKLASDPQLREKCAQRSFERSKTLNTWNECCNRIFTYLTAKRSERGG
jgi:glycosyltransferase involved in cell wall biosynthesis